MASPVASVNLNVRISWQDICATLQLPIRSQALPTRTRCPVCMKDALHLYYDNNTDGAWHHCTACNTTGDMIELAAAAWKVDNVVAIKRLAAEGVNVPSSCLVPDRINSYLFRPASRVRMQSLWEAGMKYYLETRSATIVRIKHKYSLHLDISPDRWKSGPGQLLGAAHRTSIDAAFHPGSLSRMNGTSDSSARPLKGLGWDEVIMTPFYDIPNRIRAFAFLGRKGDIDKDSVFRAVPYTSDKEAGIAYLPAIDMSGNQVEVIAVSDWMLAMQVHMRHFRTSMKALPLVAWHDDGNRKTQCWMNAIPGKRIIFWSPRKLDYNTVMQAVDADGWISTVGPIEPSPSKVSEYLRHYSTADLQRKIVQNAAPWQKALKRWLKQAGPNAAFELVTQLEHAGADVATIMRAIGNQSTNKMQPKQLTVYLDGRPVIEKGDTWIGCRKKQKHAINANNMTMIMNCVLVLTHMIKDTTSGDLYYYGFIRYKGTQVPFIELVNVLQSIGIKQWLQAKLFEHNMGVLILDRIWCPRIHQLAVTFREPVLVEDDLWRWVKKLNDAK